MTKIKNNFKNYTIEELDTRHRLNQDYWGNETSDDQWGLGIFLDMRFDEQGDLQLGLRPPVLSRLFQHGVSLDGIIFKTDRAVRRIESYVRDLDGDGDLDRLVQLIDNDFSVQKEIAFYLGGTNFDTLSFDDPDCPHTEWPGYLQKSASNNSEERKAAVDYFLHAKTEDSVDVLLDIAAKDIDTNVQSLALSAICEFLKDTSHIELSLYTIKNLGQLVSQEPIIKTVFEVLTTPFIPSDEGDSKNLASLKSFYKKCDEILGSNFSAYQKIAKENRNINFDNLICNQKYADVNVLYFGYVYEGSPVLREAILYLSEVSPQDPFLGSHSDVKDVIIEVMRTVSHDLELSFAAFKVVQNHLDQKECINFLFSVLRNQNHPSRLEVPIILADRKWGVEDRNLIIESVKHDGELKAALFDALSMKGVISDNVIRFFLPILPESQCENWCLKQLSEDSDYTDEAIIYLLNTGKHPNFDSVYRFLKSSRDMKPLPSQISQVTNLDALWYLWENRCLPAIDAVSILLNINTKHSLSMAVVLTQRARYSFKWDWLFRLVLNQDTKEEFLKMYCEHKESYIEHSDNPFLELYKLNPKKYRKFVLDSIKKFVFSESGPDFDGYLRGLIGFIKENKLDFDFRLSVALMYSSIVDENISEFNSRSDRLAESSKYGGLYAHYNEITTDWLYDHMMEDYWLKENYENIERIESNVRTLLIDSSMDYSYEIIKKILSSDYSNFLDYVSDYFFLIDEIMLLDNSKEKTELLNSIIHHSPHLNHDIVGKANTALATLTE